MTESRVALVTGITGQDGSHLADLLLEKGYDVFGLVRRHASPYRGCLTEDAFGVVQLLEADLADRASIVDVLRFVKPDEVYNLAAQSHVGTSFSQPWYTLDVTGIGPIRLFDAVLESRPYARVYQASSSEMFGATLQDAQHTLSEHSPFSPASPYGVAKVAAHYAARYYREARGLFVASGILFNHEGVRRGERFVTRKITKAVARWALGYKEHLRLGNTLAVRDWGYAPEYVEAMWRMLQAPQADEFVIATGEGHSVSDFLGEAVVAAGLTIPEYAGLVDVEVDVEQRPSDISFLIGDASKAKYHLGWAAKTRFRDLVRIMVQHDIEEGRTLDR